VRVKICGITRVEDALVAEAAGADAVGFIFAPRSKRLIDVARAAEISAALGPFIVRVGVFVDAPLEAVHAAVGAARLDAVQLNGREEPAYAAALRGRVRVIRALSFSPSLSPSVLRRYPADATLVDGLDPGSGRAFAWSQAEALRGLPRLILAGGLTPDNVAEGVRAIRPYAVDVASGVESAPGIKDSAAVHRFVAQAHAASAALAAEG
jgi:phosphoribosylanthranilate isomerase